MKTNLAIVHDPSFWPFISWADFSLMPDRDKRVIIVPIVGMTDWQMEAPLDIEECVTMSLLKTTLGKTPEAERFLVIPPVRLTMGRTGSSFFTVDADTAHSTLEEIAQSIHESGFRKILFLNSSPWNEDLVDSGGRDTRIRLGLQPFCINLSGLGLDFNEPADRERLIALRQLLFSEDSASDSAGSVIMEKASSELLELLEEVHAFRPLPHNGQIPQKQYPL